MQREHVMYLFHHLSVNKYSEQKTYKSVRHL